MPENKSPQPRDQKSLYSMAATIWSIVGGMIGCSLLGYVIGRKMGDYLTGTLIGMFMGLAYCGYEIWKVIRKPKDK
jgi:hypothetical protein